MEDGEKVLPISLFQQYPEFLLLEKDDVMVTIEHCHNCESHNWANHHIEEQYVNVSNMLPSIPQLPSLYDRLHQIFRIRYKSL